MIYLDNCATTKPYKEVLDTFIEVNNNYYGNSSSINKFGKITNKLLDAARDRIATILEVNQKKIFFTSGATESNNIAILGTIEHKKNFGSRVIVSKIEHPSVLETVRELEKKGIIVDYVNVDEKGIVDLVHLEKLLTNDTILVTIMHVNNVYGAIQPIEKISTILKKYPKVHFHVDGVQGVLKEKLSLDLVDSYSLSAHKFHGLKGIGLLYLKERRTTHNITFGGGQEDNLRSGTVNVAGAVAMAKALRISSEKVNDIKITHKQFKEKIVKELSELKYVVVNSPIDNSYNSSIVNISLPKIKGEAIVNALSEEGIMISTTSACSSKTFSLNEALYTRGLPSENIQGSVRISFSYLTTLEEIEIFIKAFKDIYYKKFVEVIESGI